MSDKKIPPGQHFIDKWPVRTAEQKPGSCEASGWKLKISGLVNREIVLRWKDIQELSVVEVTTDFHCVETWSVPENAWKGVRVKDILGKVIVKPEAVFAMIHSWGGYTSNIDLITLMSDEVILAWERNGDLIPPDHGYPLRLIVDNRYAYKSVKWVTEIELMAEDRPGFWEDQGYHKRADVWEEERLG